MYGEVEVGCRVQVIEFFKFNKVQYRNKQGVAKKVESRKVLVTFDDGMTFRVPKRMLIRVR